MSDPLTYANSDEYVLVNPNDPKVGHLIYDAPMVDADTKQFIRDPETGKIKVYRMVIWGTKGLTQAHVEALITEKNATMVTKVTNIENRLNTVLNSDDTDLDQLSELVTEIKANRSNIALLVSNKATKEELQQAVNTINTNLATVANKSNAIAVNNTPSQSLESGSGEIVPNTARLTNTVDLQEIVSKHIQDLKNVYANKDLSNVDNTGSILMAHNAMPSNKQIELTLGASESTYTAPADGYFALSAYPCNFVSLVVESAYDATAYGATAYCPNDYSDVSTFLPVRKGQTVTYRYQSGIQTSRILFRFIYAQGAVSEAN